MTCTGASASIAPVLVRFTEKEMASAFAVLTLMASPWGGRASYEYERVTIAKA